MRGPRAASLDVQASAENRGLREVPLSCRRLNIHSSEDTQTRGKLLRQTSVHAKNNARAGGCCCVSCFEALRRREEFVMLVPPFSYSTAGLAVACAGATLLLFLRVRKLEQQLRQLQQMGRPGKPKMIILMRHGESQGNVDGNAYGTIGDPNISLTELGERQAHEAGDKLAALIGSRRVAVYTSPYRRTQCTAQIVMEHLQQAGCDLHTMAAHEDPRIREREFSGTFQYEVVDRADEHDYSRFFWRPPTGESCADVYDRVSLFIDTLWRRFSATKKLEGGAILIVSHGLTCRLFAMRWLRWNVERFHQTTNLANCGHIVLQLQGPDRFGRDYYALTPESLRALGLPDDGSTGHAESQAASWEKGSLRGSKIDS